MARDDALRQRIELNIKANQLHIDAITELVDRLRKQVLTSVETG